MMHLFTVCGRWSIVTIITVLCISCACLQPIKPFDSSGAIGSTTCQLPFPSRPYRFIHAVEALPPGGTQITLMGITMIDPGSGKIRSVIMTIEGLVVFDAGYDKAVVVHRALPPFDNRNFAVYMMEDVRLIYVPPQGVFNAAGLLDDGSTICRYREDDDKVVDVIVHQDHTWEIDKYAGCSEIIRKVKAFSLQDGIPGEIELSGRHPQDYFLRLKLISAEPISPGEVY